MARYGMEVTLQGSMEEVKGRVIEALKAQGFGILTEIDVQKALKEKIGVDFEAYLILGACNPSLAHRALSADRSIGLLLPCNVVLRSAGDAVEVSILDPEVMFEVVEPKTRSVLAGLPKEAKTQLQKALDALRS
jgi:uncharacterized protein (DUF302 family)